MTAQNIDPFYIDINIATSIDFQLNLTNYVDILTTFTDECAVNSIYWHTNSHSDPINSKIEFFKNLNNKSLKIKDNPDGVVKTKTSKDDIENKNYRDQLPEQYHVKTSDGNKYGKVSVSGNKMDVEVRRRVRTWQVAPGYDDNDSQAVGEWKTDTLTEAKKAEVSKPLDIQNSPPELSSTYGMSDMGAWGIMWWIEKFNTSHDVIKQDLRDTLGEQNEYFTKFSESVGQLKNISDVWDTSTLPVWDTNVAAYGSSYSVPSTVAGIAKYCMRDEAIAFATQLSKYTNHVFRSNVCQMMEDPSQDDVIMGPMPSFTTQSHGNNMVNDFNHTSRMFSAVEKVQEVIQKHLKGLYEILNLLSNRDNYMVSDKPKQILQKVEDFTIAVDLLKNKIKSYTKDSTETVPTSRYGKYTTYNTHVSNQKKLTSS